MKLKRKKYNNKRIIISLLPKWLSFPSFFPSLATPPAARLLFPQCGAGAQDVLAGKVLIGPARGARDAARAGDRAVTSLLCLQEPRLSGYQERWVGFAPHGVSVPPARAWHNLGTSVFAEAVFPLESGHLRPLKTKCLVIQTLRSQLLDNECLKVSVLKHRHAGSEGGRSGRYNCAKNPGALLYTPRHTQLVR